MAYQTSRDRLFRSEKEFHLSSDEDEAGKSRSPLRRSQVHLPINNMFGALDPEMDTETTNIVEEEIKKINDRGEAAEKFLIHMKIIQGNASFTNITNSMRRDGIPLNSKNLKIDSTGLIYKITSAEYETFFPGNTPDDDIRYYRTKDGETTVEIKKYEIRDKKIIKTIKTPNFITQEDIKESEESVTRAERIMRYGKENKAIETPIFKITLTQDIEYITIFNKRYYTKPYTPIRITQCYNCQEYGHIWSECKAPKVCRRCSLNHAASECHIKATGETTLAKCSNCGRGHFASSGKCPIRREIIKNKIQEAKATQDQKPTTKITTIYKESSSFKTSTPQFTENLSLNDEDDFPPLPDQPSKPQRKQLNPPDLPTKTTEIQEAQVRNQVPLRIPNSIQVKKPNNIPITQSDAYKNNLSNFNTTHRTLIQTYSTTNSQEDKQDILMQLMLMTISQLSNQQAQINQNQLLIMRALGINPDDTSSSQPITSPNSTDSKC